MSPDLNGVDLNPVQDTPVATHKEDTYIHFSVYVEIQRHVEKLPKGERIMFLKILHVQSVKYKELITIHCILFTLNRSTVILNIGARLGFFSNFE